MRDKEIDERFSWHKPMEKICTFCGDVFISTHGLQQYCPEKYGKSDYCKYEQKKMVSEKKLLEYVKEVNEAKKPQVYNMSPLERNIHILDTILGPTYKIRTESERLHAMGYEINVFSRRVFAGNSDYISLVVGPFELRWIGQVGEISRFSIQRL